MFHLGMWLFTRAALVREVPICVRVAGENAVPFQTCGADDEVSERLEKVLPLKATSCVEPVNGSPIQLPKLVIVATGPSSELFQVPGSRACRRRRCPSRNGLQRISASGPGDGLSGARSGEAQRSTQTYRDQPRPVVTDELGMAGGSTRDVRWKPQFPAGDRSTMRGVPRRIHPKCNARWTGHEEVVLQVGPCCAISNSQRPHGPNIGDEADLRVASASRLLDGEGRCPSSRRGGRVWHGAQITRNRCWGIADPSRSGVVGKQLIVDGHRWRCQCAGGEENPASASTVNATFQLSPPS